jgi:hypothetical protein
VGCFTKRNVKNCAISGNGIRQFDQGGYANRQARMAEGHVKYVPAMLDHVLIANLRTDGRVSLSRLAKTLNVSHGRV